jgi:hypothetical protein
MRKGLLQLWFLVLACGMSILLPNPSQARNGPIQTDVELVFAVDVSFSMDPEEQYLQRQGYIEALRSPLLIDAINKGIHGKIAATYIEWAGEPFQRIVVPWQVIDSAASAEQFIARLEAVDLVDRREFVGRGERHEVGERADVIHDLPAADDANGEGNLRVRTGALVIGHGCSSRKPRRGGGIDAAVS